MNTVRTRFAPSPTGYLHIGAVRTAIFAWILAKQNNGQFILRIEDTDKTREVAGSEAHIKESLQWLGLTWDEGVDKGGEYGPYRQSERLEAYHAYAQKLVDEGKAYADTTTPAQLEQWRDQAKQDKKPFHFNDHRPDNPPKWEVGLPLRLKIEANESPTWHDEVRGPQKTSRENIDDFIIIKADGYPTYNFAHIVDDYEMKITHVIRGEEFVSSMPKFLMLYQALNIEPPIFAHLPNILAPTGNKKLSKRDGAPDLLQYRDMGYLPEAILNFLSLLGWNDGTEQEVYSRQELIEKFSLDRVQKAGARYDEDRLRWISGHHIRSTPLDELYRLVSDGLKLKDESLKSWWPESAAQYDNTYKKHVLTLVHERLKYLSELSDLTDFFFTRPQFDPTELFAADKQLRKLSQEEQRQMLEATTQRLQATEFTEAALEETLRTLVETLNTKAGVLFKLIRICVTGSQIAPGLFETLATLGQEESLARLADAVQQLK